MNLKKLAKRYVKFFKIANIDSDKILEILNATLHSYKYFFPGRTLGIQEINSSTLRISQNGTIKVYFQIDVDSEHYELQQANNTLKQKLRGRFAYDLKLALNQSFEVNFTFFPA